MPEVLTDFPKLYCPFIRQTFKVNYEHFKKFGSSYQLREPQVYLVVNQINPGYEWVLEDKDTIAIEKLNGTNVKILTNDKTIIAIQNRQNVVDPLSISGRDVYIMEGIYRSIQLDFVKPNSEQCGELIGTKIQGNPYKIDGHLWYSFEVAVSRLKYNSFDKYERTFDNLSSWFKDYLFSRFYEKKATKENLDSKEKIFAEGVVFYNFKRQAENKTWRAKLRRDMFDWYYDKIEILDYCKSGKDEKEDQEKFE